MNFTKKIKKILLNFPKCLIPIERLTFSLIFPSRITWFETVFSWWQIFCDQSQFYFAIEKNCILKVFCQFWTIFWNFCSEIDFCNRPKVNRKRAGNESLLKLSYGGGWFLSRSESDGITGIFGIREKEILEVVHFKWNIMNIWEHGSEETANFRFRL